MNELNMGLECLEKTWLSTCTGICPVMSEPGFPFYFSPSVMLCTERLSAPLAAGFTECSKSHTDFSGGEQDPKEVFSVCHGLRSLHGSDCRNSSSALRWLFHLMQAARAIKVT